MSILCPRHNCVYQIAAGRDDMELKSHLKSLASVQYVISVQCCTYSTRDNYSDRGRESKGEGPITRFTVLVTKSAPFPAHSVGTAHTYINASHACPARGNTYITWMPYVRAICLWTRDGIRMDERWRRETGEWASEELSLQG